MKVITLRLYKGLKLLFNEQGQVENKNQLIKLIDGEEWLNYLSLIKAQGLCKVTLVSVMESVNSKLTPVTGDHLKLIVSQLVKACGKSDETDKELRLELPKEAKSDDEKIKDLASKMGDKTKRSDLEERALKAGVKFSAMIGDVKLEERVLEAEKKA
jgi:hypothetical protein